MKMGKPQAEGIVLVILSWFLLLLAPASQDITGALLLLALGLYLVFAEDT